MTKRPAPSLPHVLLALVATAGPAQAMAAPTPAAPLRVVG